MIISEDEAYCMHTQNKTIPLHADEDELDEIVEELRGQLFKYKDCFQDIAILKGFQGNKKLVHLAPSFCGESSFRVIRDLSVALFRRK